MDFGGRDQASISRSRIERGLYFVVAWQSNSVPLDPGAKGWLFRDGHDIPEDKIRR